MGIRITTHAEVRHNSMRDSDRGMDGADLILRISADVDAAVAARARAALVDLKTTAIVAPLDEIIAANSTASRAVCLDTLTGAVDRMKKAANDRRRAIWAAIEATLPDDVLVELATTDELIRLLGAGSARIAGAALDRAGKHDHAGSVDPTILAD